jgi:hypothetical protein
MVRFAILIHVNLKISFRRNGSDRSTHQNRDDPFFPNSFKTVF